MDDHGPPANPAHRALVSVSERFARVSATFRSKVKLPATKPVEGPKAKPVEPGQDQQNPAKALVGAVVINMNTLAAALREHHRRATKEFEARRARPPPWRDGLPWSRKRRRGHQGGGMLRFGGPAAQARAMIEQGKQHERSMDIRAAIRCYEEANRLVAGNAETLALCAKAWSDACYLGELKRERLSEQDKRELNFKALEYARQAIAAAPDKSLPHVAACISMGRLAVMSDNKTKVRLAKEAREQATVALRMEPGSDLAHHLMGRWHYEMAQLNGVVRYLIRLMYGTTLQPGSHAEAVACYERATALNPRRLIHRVELGRALEKVGQRERAARELQASLAMDVEDINAHLQRADAEELLKGLRRTPWWQRHPLQQAKPQVTTETAGQEESGAPSPLPLPWAQWRLPWQDAKGANPSSSGAA